MRGVNSQGIPIAVLVLYALTIGKSHGAPLLGVELADQRRLLNGCQSLALIARAVQ
jgi:hypothetical protein